jgi:hypothetical protein
MIVVSLPLHPSLVNSETERRERRKICPFRFESVLQGCFPNMHFSKILHHCWAVECHIVRFIMLPRK